MPAKFSKNSTICPCRSRKRKSLWRHARRSALLLPIILTGCQTTTGSVATSGARFCDVARAIYWSRHDTAPTIEQIKEHNAVGLALKCGWKGAKGK